MIVLSLSDVKDIFDSLAQELEIEAKHESSSHDVSSALYAVAHRFNCIDWDWYEKQATKGGSDDAS